MLHLADNIKIIRGLLGQTQEQFRQNFTNVSLAMQKSYEGGKAIPDLLYLQELSALAGVPVDKLGSKALTKKDITLKVEKVDKGEATRAETNDAFAGFSETSSFHVIIRLAEANAKLSDGQKELIETNRLMAEANLKIANSHEELVQMTKKSIADASLQNSPDVAPSWAKLLAVLAQFGVGIRWQTAEEGEAILGSMIYGGSAPVVSAGTQTHSGKKHSGK